MQDTPSVRTDLNSGTHFTKRRSPLKDRDIVTTVRNDQRRSKSANTSTNNSEPHQAYSMRKPGSAPAIANSEIPEVTSKTA